MTLNFVWLEDFLSLAVTGNFSRSAEDRHSSQPAFSRRIRALEEWIGAPLVDRTTQPARLTQVGVWFQGIAEELVARAARLPGEARQVAEASSVTLRIASTHALSSTFLPRWLRSLESLVTLGPVELASDVLARCEAQMQEGKVHFVLAHAHPRMHGSLETKSYFSTQIGSDELVPVSKPDEHRQSLHRLENAVSKEPVPLLEYTQASGMGRIVRAVLGNKLEEIRHQVVFTAHLASVLRSMALDGRGIAWLPRTLVEDDLEAGRLVVAAEPRWTVALEIRLYRQQAEVGRTAEAFWRAAIASRLAVGTGQA